MTVAHLAAGTLLIIAMISSLCDKWGNGKAREPDALDYLASLIIGILACFGAGWLLYYLFP